MKQRLNAVLVKNYLSTADASGNRVPMFMYKLSGSPEAVEAFREAKAEYYHEDEHGNPLYHTKRGFGNTGVIEVTDDGKVVHDDSSIAMASSIINQIPAGALRDAVANQLATKLLGDLNAKVDDAPAPKQAESEEQTEDQPLEELD